MNVQSVFAMIYWRGLQFVVLCLSLSSRWGTFPSTDTNDGTLSLSLTPITFFFFFTPTKHQAYGTVYSYSCQGFFYSHWPQSCSPKVCRAVNWPFCKSLENPDLLYREYVIPHPSFREHLSDNIYTHPAWRGCQPTFIFLSCIFVPPYPEGPHKPERAHQGENSQATSLLHVEEL